MDGITDISYDESEAKISFKMDSFQAFALMQKTYANLPFQSWELRPLGQDSALYTVNGAFMNISITIQVRRQEHCGRKTQEINRRCGLTVTICASVSLIG